MSNRERWIVYPLLFCALGLGVRDQLSISKDIDAENIRCRSLTVVSGQSVPAVSIGVTPSGLPTLLMSAFVDAGAAENVASEMTESPPAEAARTDQTQNGVANAASAPRVVVQLTATAEGGMLRLFGPSELPALRIGHLRSVRASGLMGEAPLGKILTPEPNTSQVSSREAVLLAWPSEPTQNDPSAPQPNAELEPEPEPAEPVPELQPPANDGAPVSDENGPGEASDAESAGGATDASGEAEVTSASELL